MTETPIVLKPCPFCGGAARVAWPHGDGNVKCTVCPATIWRGPGYGVNFYQQAEHNAALWNNRTER